MNMKKIALVCSFILILSNTDSVAQQWRTLTRQQKDSVINTYFAKGHKYVGIGIVSSFQFGAGQGHSYKIEPSFGYVFKERQMIAANAIIEIAKTQIDEDYQKHTQYTLGGFYRLYLPERKTYTSIFVQSGLQAGKFFGQKNTDGIYDEIDFFVLNVHLGVGISIPINKFNLELGMTKEIQLLNQRNYDDYYGGKLQGIICISYIF
jgi:hypothetical protein